MSTRSSKKVLLIVVDALASDVIRPAMQSGVLPTFSALADAGQVTDSTAIFPSITPAATASIATGTYPAQHGIAGAYWWNEEHNTISFFGADLWVIFNQGPKKYFQDFMVTLNEKHLNVDPIFQSIEREGCSAAVINFMWFRGDSRHEVSAPFLINLLAGEGIPDTVAGPKYLALADFVPLKVAGCDEPFSANAGLMKRHGFHDEFTAKYLFHLLDSPEVPDFTLAYFPNNDFESHKQGPVSALSTVKEVDAVLAELIEQHGGLESFLQQFSIVITGDHSQSLTLDDPADRDIVLDELLPGFQQATPGKPWEDGDEILICPNLRAAQVYASDHMPKASWDRLLKDLLQEPRIDQIILQQQESDAVTFIVKTADRGECRFRSSDQGVGDCYGNMWQIEGNPAAIDATIDGDEVCYGDYPNALERIANGFSDKSASVWITAKLGHEFRIAETHTHAGGSHGSLHVLDSTSPLIAAGLPEGIRLPQNARTIDVAPLCRRALFSSE